jgi:hypothetical protein
VIGIRIALIRLANYIDMLEGENGVGLLILGIEESRANLFPTLGIGVEVEFVVLHEVLELRNSGEFPSPLQVLLDYDNIGDIFTP